MTEREYKDLVLADYDRKLAAGELPQELVSPTRKSLKAQCVNSCAQHYEPKDELLLRSLFGAKDTAGDYIKAIKTTSAEKFKTLHNFLNDRAINTSFENINLLAWLINFKPRPYNPSLNYITPTIEPISSPIPTLLEKDHTPIADVKDRPLIRRRINRVVLYGLLFLATSFIGYIIVDHQLNALTGNEGCMVWSADHYKPIDCSAIKKNGPMLKLDKDKLESFKRIDADTLTPRALGHVWYAKINGNIEFYSDSGQHPVQTNRRLLKLSSYILNKYVFKVANAK